MYKKITFRSMDHSDAIEKHVLDKAEKLDKFFKREPAPVDIEIILEAHREKHYFKAEVIVTSKNYHLVAHSEGSDMYAMIDDAMHKMIREIANKKEEMGHDISSHHIRD
ncbi:MAG: ribosome-associated translation inhibitor RaiA [Candidatus Dependentiae bacterium]|nr:ribosome-associated translation inhibitor RaiA [Candidatus Dependentiae bacterium]